MFSTAVTNDYRKHSHLLWIFVIRAVDLLREAPNLNDYWQIWTVLLVGYRGFVFFMWMSDSLLAAYELGKEMVQWGKATSEREPRKKKREREEEEEDTLFILGISSTYTTILLFMKAELE